MYKIFINENPLVISDDEADLHKYRKYHFADDDDRAVMAAVDILEHQPYNHSSFGIFILTESEKKTFSAFRKHYHEIVAGGGVVFNPKNEILIIKRQGRWDLPKGKNDDNETIEQTALREVKEECGFTNLELGEPITKSYHTYPQEGQKILKTTHWFRLSTHEIEGLTPQAEENITELRWVDLENFDFESLDTYNSIKRVLRITKENYLKGKQS